jgi:Mor family transcriptional regulator
MKFSEFVPVDISRVSSQQLELVNTALDKDSPEIWRDLAELYFLALRNSGCLKGLKDESLVEVAIALVYQTIQNLGGTAVYLPKGRRLNAGERNTLIEAEYRGNNLKSIAKKYDLTVVHVRQILKRKPTAKRASSTET